MRLLLLAVLAGASVSHAFLVPQQRGGACDAVWNTGLATVAQVGSSTRPWELVCPDGDFRCDRDGVVNGTCQVRVAACVGMPTAGCTPAPVTSLRIARRTRRTLDGLVPPSLGDGSDCGTAGTVVLAASGRRNRSTIVSLRSRTAGGRGRNRLRIRCMGPVACFDCPERCDPRLCQREAPGLPSNLELTVMSMGSDLDLGFSGDGHNFPLAGGVQFGMCLSGCDGTTDSICDATPTCPANAEPGVPRPLLANGVPVCVVPRAVSAAGTVDLATGAMTLPAALEADVYVQMPLDNVCPRCSGGGIGEVGTCSAGPRRDEPCMIEGTAHVVGSGGSWDYTLSSQCLPDEGRRVTTLPIALTLSTGAAQLDGALPCAGQVYDDSCGPGSCTTDCSGEATLKGGINQTCCSSSASRPCFPSDTVEAAGVIQRTGTAVVPAPAWPDATYPKAGDGAVLAGLFCLPRTTDATADILSGLPGPGAVLAPVSVTVGAQP